MPTLSYSVYVHIAILKLLFQKVFIHADKAQDKNSLFASFFLSKIPHFIENYKINIKSLANDCISNFCIYWIERTKERTKKNTDKNDICRSAKNITFRSVIETISKPRSSRTAQSGLTSQRHTSLQLSVVVVMDIVGPFNIAPLSVESLSVETRTVEPLSV